ncbi:hypothetical protein KUCAC02_017299 [Chaenocephalus aceratus]|uniref:Uncharacterized protein n=1 Tax=Chaenocephalus aceratus TaxID=36190 RepID=A0ACB9W1L1_CHAAC|nr:hypothetical protein KUCAC02_017299 [Chaenocephalus aceratus]
MQDLFVGGMIVGNCIQTRGNGEGDYASIGTGPVRCHGTSIVPPSTWAWHRNLHFVLRAIASPFEATGIAASEITVGVPLSETDTLCFTNGELLLLHHAEERGKSPTC